MTNSSLSGNDDSAALLERVKQASLEKKPIQIVGGNSKAHLGNSVSNDKHELCSISEHKGIIAYDPTELVVTVRAGTPVDTLNAVLAEAGQMLPFEPPVMPGSTIGGILACGMSGPRRPFSGSARDYVLGMRVINGLAEDLSFGGEVMKNVAGYDVSRLQVGAWGTLGVLLESSMKVLPKPEAERTLCLEAKADETESFAALLRQPMPLSGAMQIRGQRYLRLSGSASAVDTAAKTLGGDVIENASDFWISVRDLSHDFFDGVSAKDIGGPTLWRVSVADYAPALAITGDWMYDWAGAQRWLITREPAGAVFAAARKCGGYATRYSAGPAGEAFQPLSGPMCSLQARVRDSFDPHRIFNRGRFHPELDTELASSDARQN